MSSSEERTIRREGAMVFLVCVGVLMAAFLLRPEARGYGTHEQLWLPPCWFKALTGWPCAFCGMTTGYCLMARGEVWEAVRANPAAPVGFALTWVSGGMGLWAWITGRGGWMRVLRDRRAARVMLWAVVAVWVGNIVAHWVQ